MCTLKEPFETIPSHQKPCLNHAEKGHMPMYIEHIITYNSISIHSKQSQYNFINFLYNSDNPDSYYLLNFLNSSYFHPPWSPHDSQAAATHGSQPPEVLPQRHQDRSWRPGQNLRNICIFWWTIPSFEGETPICSIGKSHFLMGK